jgi:thiol-disulfide isomerase/thioredoxin
LWVLIRPVARLNPTPLAGQSLLLEFQSPYCLGCIAMKPAVDRLEMELRGKLVVRRVDIQSEEGRKLALQYGFAATPTFIFFDKDGKEQWRNVGGLDTERVRTSVRESAAIGGSALSPK